MPPDALQPKTYCSDPGLQSFLLAPPGVSTRDPSSERRNYLGEKSPVISTESCDFHAYTFGFFYMPQICDMGQTALLLPKEGVQRIFFALKNPTASAGFEPANLGTKGQHATSRPPKSLICSVRYYCRNTSLSVNTQRTSPLCVHEGLLAGC